MPIDEILSCSWLFVVLEKKADFALTYVQQKIYFHLFTSLQKLPETCWETRNTFLQIYLIWRHWNTGEEWNSTKPYYFMIKLWIQCTGMSNWTPQIAVWFLPSPACAWVSVFLYSHRKATVKGCFSEVFQFTVYKFFEMHTHFPHCQVSSFKDIFEVLQFEGWVLSAYHLTILISSCSLTKTQINNYFVKLYFEYLM